MRSQLLASVPMQRTYLSVLWLTNFVDPRIALRLTLGRAAEPVGALVGFTFLVMTLALLRDARGPSRTIAQAILGFGVASAIRALAGGVPISWVVQTLPPFFAGAGCTLAANDDRFLRGIRNAFVIAMVAHAAVILAPSSSLAASLGEQTAYGMDAGDATGSVSAVRATGLLNAPGFLSLYSAIGLALSLDLARSSPLSATALLLTSVLCGIATGNRSFLIVSAFVVALAAVASSMSRGGGKGLLAIVVLGIAASSVAYSTNYEETMHDRFDADIIDRDSDVRLRGASGLLDALDVAADHPLVGAFAADSRGRAVGVWSGREFINPHNNFVWVLSTRGVFALCAYVWGIGSALARAWRFRGQTADRSIPSQSLLLALVAGLATCSVEPLGEVGPMLIIVGLCLGLTLRPTLDLERSKAA